MVALCRRPNSQGEGFFGLVLCAPCYVARVEEKAGPQQALDTLMAIMRRDQRLVAERRRRRARP